MSHLRACLVLLLTASTCWADVEVRTISGPVHKGKVVAISPTEVVLNDNGTEIKTPLAQVLAIQIGPSKAPSKDTKHTLLKLFDDSRLHCGDVVFQGNQLDVTLLSGHKLKVPLSSVVELIREAQDAKLTTAWNTLAAEKVKRDRIVINRQGELAALEGTLGDVDPQGKTIQFRKDDNTIVPIALDRLHGMIYYRKEVPEEAPTCIVYDAEGNSFAATKVSILGSNYTISTPTGATFTYDEAKLARLDYNLGKLTFLSDLDPGKTVERSGVGLIVRYRRDANLDGDRIVLAGVNYNKGLSMHAHTELEYNLDGKYKEFKAVLGVDLRTGGDSKATVSIECDGAKIFSQLVDVKSPRPIALNVRDVQKLRIIVQSRNFLDLHDHATLAEARVSQ